MTDFSEEWEWAASILEKWEDALEAVREAQEAIAAQRRRGIYLEGEDRGVVAGNAAINAVSDAVAGYAEVYRKLRYERREKGGSAG